MRTKSFSLLGILAILLVVTLFPPAGLADPSPVGQGTPTVNAVLSTSPPPPHIMLGGSETPDWATMAAFGLTAGLIGLMRKRLGWV